MPSDSPDPAPAPGPGPAPAPAPPAVIKPPEILDAKTYEYIIQIETGPGKDGGSADAAANLADVDLNSVDLQQRRGSTCSNYSEVSGMQK